MRGHVVFLSGPIGVGKSTLGRSLAERLLGVFLDGDNFSQCGAPWYSCTLRTSQDLLEAGMAAVSQSGLAIVAYPLRRTNWVFFKRSFADRGIANVFVGLRASYGAITDESRGRVFSNEEKDRIKAMIAQGYGARCFSDVIVDTDAGGLSDTLFVLERNVRSRIGR